MSYQPERPEAVARASKTVQAYINTLEHMINSQNAHIAAISSQHPGSNVVMDGGYGKPEITLEPDSTIRFYLGTGRDRLRDVIEVHHERRDNSVLDVRSNGYGLLLVSPWASNSVRLQIGDR